MKSLIKKIAQGLLSVAVFALAFGAIAPTAPAYALDCTGADNLSIQCGANSAQGSDAPSGLFDGDAPVFQTIVNVLLFIIGAVAVIMLIIGGIRYVVSGGDQAQVTGAKNTILYAIIGIVVAVLAYAVVNFVLGSLLPNA